jgi:hypothetical protein
MRTMPCRIEPQRAPLASAGRMTTRPRRIERLYEAYANPRRAA